MKIVGVNGSKFIPLLTIPLYGHVGSSTIGPFFIRKIPAEIFICDEEMFQPRQVASCPNSLWVRVIPVHLGWTPVFDKEIPSARMKYILKLDEKERKWSLIYWEIWDKSKNFSRMDFSVKSDPDNILLPRISQLGSYDIINEHISNKLKDFKEEILTQNKK